MGTETNALSLWRPILILNDIKLSVINDFFLKHVTNLLSRTTRVTGGAVSTAHFKHLLDQMLINQEFLSLEFKSSLGVNCLTNSCK